jgi:hypothetical protein
LHYFPSGVTGFGVKYSLNKNKGEDASARVADDITMHYIAASLLTRSVMKDERNSLTFGFNCGYQSYKDVATVQGSSLTLSGGTFGAGLELGFGHKVSTGSEFYLAFGLQSGMLNQITIDDGYASETVKLEKEEREGLGRLEVTLGLKFGK